MIVAMDPASCLQAAPLPWAVCRLYTAMCLTTPPPSYTRLLKTHAELSLGRRAQDISIKSEYVLL